MTACSGGGGGGGTSVPTTPVETVKSKFTSDVTSVVAGGEIVFTDKSEQAMSAKATFSDDGSVVDVAIGGNFKHVFKKVGTWAVDHTAIGADGKVSTSQAVIVVTATPVVVVPPVADLVIEGGAVTGVAPFTVSATSTSIGADSLVWNFGDISPSETTQSIIHVYSVPGIYQLSLTTVNPGGTDSKTVQITVTTPIADLLLSPVPANELGEAITILGNRPVVDAIPNVAINANTLVNDVSAVFAKTTSKRYSMDSFKTYTDAEFAGIATNPAFFKDNAYPSNSRYGGTTVVYYLYNNVSELPALFTTVGHHMFTTFTSIGGKTYGLIYVASYAPRSELNGRIELSKTFPTMYDYLQYGFCQELGHTLGLGSPEWYGVTLVDNSGISPNLGSYSLRAAYPMDPMTTPLNWNGIQFNAFNSWLVTNNANHQIEMWQVFSNLPKTIKVRIVDALGNPVAGASVKVYEALKNQVAPAGSANYYVQTDMSLPEALLQNAISDTNGEIVITRDFSIRLAKMVKAWSGTKSGGAFMEAVDLEDQRWRNGFIVSHTKNIVIQ